MTTLKNRNKKLEEKEGGALPLDEAITLIRHADMIKCVKHGIEEPELYTWTIETIRESGNNAHKMATICHSKKAFTTYDDKISNARLSQFRMWTL